MSWTEASRPRFIYHYTLWPLFLEGEAGVGKTEIAKVLSETLGREIVCLQYMKVWTSPPQYTPNGTIRCRWSKSDFQKQSAIATGIALRTICSAKNF